MPDDMDSLKGVILGLGLKELPKLLVAFHRAKELGAHVQAGRSSKGTHPEADALHSAVAPLLQHLQQAGTAASAPGAPPQGPGMQGAAPPAMPKMPTLPRTMNASMGAGGFA